LERFGHHYGLALQIADDIVDISDSPDETGKSFAPDLRGRRMRLPVILGLKLGNARVRRTLEQLLSSRTVNGTQASAARVAIIESGALTASAAAAKRHARAALASLDSFGDAFSIRALRALASTLLPAQGIGP
jgi:geranylgeranyl pyrophosphate synthase